MRLPRRNRGTWIFAGISVVVAIVVVGIAIHELSKPSNSVNTKLPVTIPSTTTTGKLKATTKVVDNFTWPLYGYTLTRTRDFSAASNLNPPFTKEWSFGGNALLEFPPSIYGNSLYFMDDGATVKRVNIKTGKQIWLRHVGTLSASTPALDVSKKMLFVSVLSDTGTAKGSVDGEVAALSMTDRGKILWRYPVPSGTESSPIVVGNSVYFGDQGGTETSLNIMTGKQNWTFSTGGSIKAGADYYDGNLYFGNYAGQFYAVNAKTGKPVWSISPGGEFYSTPSVAYGLVYTGNNDGAAFAFETSNGETKWTRSLGGYVYSAPAVADIPGLGPTVYIGSYDGDFYALNATDGTPRWTYVIPGDDNAVSGSATVIDNTVYFSTVYHVGSYGLNARTGQKVFYYPDGSYTTVVADPDAVFLMGKYVIYKFVPKH
jgi:outer membrane protein assembly factor BamB